jgi:hypothetical protein
MGYAYKTHAAPSILTGGGSGAPQRRHLLPHHANESVATFTGFEMLADGGSRLFVQLSKQVDVSQEKADEPGARAVRGNRKGKQAHAEPRASVVSRLKFVLKGTEIVNPINEGALVTVHFNTPIVRARIVPAGRDLHLMVELRADVTPQMKIVPAKDNGAMLQIDFPQGSYLPAGATDPAPGTAENAGASTPAFLPTTPGTASPQAGANDSMGPK